MKKETVLFLLFFGAFFFSGCQPKRTLIAGENYSVPTAVPSNAPTPVPFEPFTAKFEIYTHTTKRIFTDKKYHRQSFQAFIDLPDPSVIHVEESGITWNDFFETLPFSLAKDCLVTGTKQTFCTNGQYTLRFFVNGVEIPGALDQEIRAGDFLKVTYGN